MMNFSNVMTQVNKNCKEAANQINEMVTKNFETINGIYKNAGTQNDEAVAKNMQTYFSQINSNINYVNSIWTGCIKDRKELTDKYFENVNTLYETVNNVYRNAMEIKIDNAK